MTLLSGRTTTPPEPNNTRELIHRCLAEEDSAWSELDSRLRRRFRLVVRSRIPRKMRQRFDTDDVLQSAVLSVYEHLDRFQYSGKGSLDRWVHRIVERRIRSRVRQHGAIRRDVDCELPLQDGASQNSPESEAELVDRADLMVATMKGLADLDASDLKLVQLHFFDGQTVRQIARDRSVPESRVPHRLAKVVVRLQYRLNAPHAR